MTEYQKMRLEDLRDLAGARNLSKAGNKAALIERHMTYAGPTTYDRMGVRARARAKKRSAGTPILS